MDLDLEGLNSDALSADGDTVVASAYVDMLAGFVFGELSSSSAEETGEACSSPTRLDRSEIVLLKLE
jgi:hypothetical protein